MPCNPLAEQDEALPKSDSSWASSFAAHLMGGASRFIDSPPKWLQMRVAQGGINFSGGQRQRLASARGVIRRPAIYLFDHAFSAVDVHTDALVRASPREISADSTVIIVAQRISTVLQADQVVVVDGGRVVGSGTHESLLLDCPTYVEFVDSQSLSAVVGPPMTRPAHQPLRLRSPPAFCNHVP